MKRDPSLIAKARSAVSIVPFGAGEPAIVLKCICDACKAAGALGLPPFEEQGDLLDFAPVPRRLRGDGWLPGLQKLFIAALALTGSRNKAVLAVGKTNGSVEYMRAAEGAEEFNAAYDRALALYEERYLARAVRRMGALTDGLAARTDYLDPPEPVARPAPAPAPAPVLTAADVAAKVAVIEGMLAARLKAEAQLRAAGQIVAANLALRAAARFEVMIELARTTEPATVDAFMAGLQTASGAKEAEVLDTPAGRAADAARRAAWAADGAPERPRPLPGPDDPAAAAAGIADHGDHRRWNNHMSGGLDFARRLAERKVALWNPGFRGEREVGDEGGE